LLTTPDTWVHLVMSRSQEKFQAVLFDLDGVLIDSYDAWFHQFQQTLRYFGYGAVSEEEFRRHWGQSTEDDIRLFMPGMTLDAIRQYFYDHYDAYVKYLRLEANAVEVLGTVREYGLRVGCVTNSHRDIVVKTLKHFSMESCFDTIITADDVRMPKPQPEMIIMACHALAVLPRNTVFVGDTETDLKAAAGAGCVFVGYRIDAETRIDNLLELLSWFRKLVSKSIV